MSRPKGSKNIKAEGETQENPPVETPATETTPASAVEVKLDKLIDGMNTMAGALKALFEKQSEPKASTPEAKEPETAKTVANTTATQEMRVDSVWFNDKGVIPPKFREIINEVLSPEFGIEIEYFDDSPNYTIHISVPEKFSSVPKEHYIKGVRDVRSKVIPAAHGANGVRDWASLVRKNLNAYFSKSGVQTPFKNNY